MENCVFCKIVKGDLPSVKVYEDDLVYAFLDIAPINKGHMLVIPKEHHVGSNSIPEDVGGRMFKIGSKLGIAGRRVFEQEGFNLHLADGSCAGQVVMHAHLHVIPRGAEDGFHWNWRQLSYDNEAERAEIAESIVSKLKV